MTLFGVVAAGVLGNLVGSLIAYAAGYYGRIELLEQNRFIHINRKHLEWADNWFQRHGSATVFFSRMLPISPHLHLAAGRRRADAVRALRALHHRWLHPLGPHAGAHRPGGRLRWEDWRATSTTSTTWCSRPIVLGIVYLIVKRRRAAASPESTPSA